MVQVLQQLAAVFFSSICLKGFLDSARENENGWPSGMKRTAPRSDVEGSSSPGQHLLLEIADRKELRRQSTKYKA